MRKTTREIRAFPLFFPSRYSRIDRGPTSRRQHSGFAIGKHDFCLTEAPSQRNSVATAALFALGLDIVSEKTDRGRFYRISESRLAAR
jgi:hypothetical protein